MSDLLEKAIVDAKALKEAALKNAENLVIEKYSQEVKETMSKLLEGPLDDVLGGEAGGAPDMSAPNTGEDDFSAPPPEEEKEDSAAEQMKSQDNFTDDIPLGFRADADDEEQMIRIQLDSIDLQDDEEDDGVFGGDDKLDDDEIGIDITSDEDSEPAVADIDMDATADGGNFDALGDISPAALAEMASEVLQELDIDEGQLDLDELMERVRVEGEPQKSGWAGTPESVMREYEAMLLAREQDSKVKEENEELRKTVASLQEENSILSSAALKLQKQNKKFNTAFNTLQEKLETMNVSNAKLLYINQALENASLNERQKRKIVEAISKAETVQEAKIMFETLNETVTTNSDVKKDVTLSEMVSRKSSLLVAARKEQPKNDVNPFYTRMQRLAGIKDK